MEFEWFPGFSVAQKQRSVRSMHSAAQRHGLGPVLEVSTKSTVELGTQLSAFNLRISESTHGSISLECAFQGSKLLERGGPFPDLFSGTPKAAKRDPRLQSYGPLIGFVFNGARWSREPKTAFYDWLYLSAVFQLQNRGQVVDKLKTYQAFTDIEFNPARSLNCQARSCALLVALSTRGMLDECMASTDVYLRAHRSLVKG